MYRFQIAVLGLVLAVSATYSQVPTKTAPSDVRLDATKPIAYIKFERYDEEYVWLRLLNNSKWAVAIYVEEPLHNQEPAKWESRRDAFGLSDGIEVRLIYKIEREPAEESVYQSGCLFSDSWIPTGRSVMIKIKRSHLVYPATLRVPFRYEWELKDEPEPEHYLYFSGHQLPPSEK